MTEIEEQSFSARLQTLLGSGATADDLEALRAEAADRLGPGHSVSLFIECSAEYVRSSRRSIQASVDAWRRLMKRAAGELPEGDLALMAIRSYYVRHVRFRGDFGDLDAVVELRKEQCALLHEHQADQTWINEDWIGMAAADLAVALTDRSRFGHLDPLIESHDPQADQRLALRLIEPEVTRRRRRHTADHPFTWKANRVLTTVIVALVYADASEPRHDAHGRALAMADELLHHHWKTDRSHTPPLRQAQLLRAEALIACGRHREAACEVHFLCAGSRTRLGNLDPGRPFLTLARARAAWAPADGLIAAKRALSERRRLYSPRSHKVAEAAAMVAALDG